MKRLALLTIKSLPYIVVLLVIIEIAVTNELVHFGRNVQSIDADIFALQDENESLAQKVASASSLLAIEDKAKAMGFIPATSPISLGQEVVALESH